MKKQKYVMTEKEYEALENNLIACKAYDFRILKEELKIYMKDTIRQKTIGF